MGILYNSTLQRKSPLKVNVGLKRDSKLKSKKCLKSKTDLKANTELQCYNYMPSKRKNSKKKGTSGTVTEYWSIFTEEMSVCYITGDTNNVDPHHIFGASNKSNSEKYGFILPLRRDWHETANYSIHRDRTFEVKIKMQCEDYWTNALGKTKGAWIKIFGKWWDVCDFPKTA